MSETRETAIERHLDGLTSEPEWDTMHEGERHAIIIARDLVRCWRELLEPDIHKKHDPVRIMNEARALLARGDAL